MVAEPGFGSVQAELEIGIVELSVRTRRKPVPCVGPILLPAHGRRRSLVRRLGAGERVHRRCEGVRRQRDSTGTASRQNLRPRDLHPLDPQCRERGQLAGLAQPSEEVDPVSRAQHVSQSLRLPAPGSPADTADSAADRLGTALDELLERTHGALPVRDHERQPALHRRASHPQRVRHIHQGQVGAGSAEVVAQSLRAGCEQLVSACGQHHQFLARASCRRGSPGTVLLDDHVRVHPSCAERAHPRDMRLLLGGPRAGDRGDRERGTLKVDLRVRLLRPRRGQDSLMLQLEEHPGETGDPRRRLEVADHGLHTGDKAGLPHSSPRGERLAEPADLDGITEGGSRPVRLDHGHPLSRQARVLEGVAHELRLPGGARYGEPLGVPGGVDGGASQHRVNVVPVSLSRLERLEEDSTGSFAHDHAVGPGTEGSARTRRRQHAHVRVLDEAGRVQDQVDPTGDGRVRPTAAEVLARQVQSHPGARAGRVHGDAGAVEVMDVRDSVGDLVQRRVRKRRNSLNGRLRGRHSIVAGHGSDVNTDASTQARRSVAGVLERLRGRQKEEALLRVHRRGLERRDLEVQRVEGHHVVEEAPAPRPRALRLGEDVPERPSLSGRRNLAHLGAAAG